jgi:hypothetical protein
MTSTSEHDRLTARGYSDGHAAGTWVVDGNTTDETCHNPVQRRKEHQ